MMQFVRLGRLARWQCPSGAILICLITAYSGAGAPASLVVKLTQASVRADREYKLKSDFGDRDYGPDASFGQIRAENANKLARFAAS
ncbi:MAG: hypothetical protein VR74_07160 [Hyphomonas sp. BRH_c22]|nr:MAG: hypothetical protein VR74_07160 [Hyphomonas sp. BRH_c22]